MRGPRSFVTRQTLTSWLIFAGIVLVTLLANRPRAALADPVACPGLIELAAATAASSSRVPIATTLWWMNIAGVVLAAFAFSRLNDFGSRFRGGSQPETTPEVISLLSAGAAVASTQIFGSTLAPSSALAFAAACVGFIAIGSPASGSRPTGLVLELARGLTLGVAAGIAPALTLPIAVVATLRAWLYSREYSSRRRVATVAVAVAGVAIAPVLVAIWMVGGPQGPLRTPAGTSCVALSGFRPAVDAATGALGQVALGAAPLSWGLAALGAFTVRGLLQRREVWPIVAFAATPLAVVFSPDADRWRALAPVIVGFWWLVAVGLRDVVSGLGAGYGRRLVAAALVLALPLLQYSRRPDPAVARLAEPWGHEDLTRRDIVRLLDVLPAGAALVVDDAMTDLLLRAATGGWGRKRRAVSLVPRRPDAVAAELGSSRVFALPRAQRELQHQGFRIGGGIWPGLTGVSELLAGGSCRALTSDWAEFPGLHTASTLAFVATRANARGPILLYLGSEVPLDPRPLDWSPRELRGFHTQMFPRGSHTGHPPEADALFKARYVLRLELWRVPDGALILPVALNGPPDTTLANDAVPSDAGGVRLCPSFPQDVELLTSSRR